MLYITVIYTHIQVNIFKIVDIEFHRKTTLVDAKKIIFFIILIKYIIYVVP